MSWKQFLKPDWRKIVIFVIGVLIALYFSFNIFYLLPPCPLNVECGPIPEYDMIYDFMIPFAIIWYLLSCLIVRIYDKIKKR